MEPESPPYVPPISVDEYLEEDAKRRLEEAEMREIEREGTLGTLTSKAPIHYRDWVLWPKDDAHRARMEEDIERNYPIRRSNYLNDPPLPRFVETHLAGEYGFNNRHMVSKKDLQPFLKFQWGHTYRIQIMDKNSYAAYIPGVHYYIVAIFVNYIFNKYTFPLAKMFVVETNLPINLNELRTFSIGEFSNWMPPNDVTTPESLAQFKKERSASQATVTKMVVKKILNERRPKTLLQPETTLLPPETTLLQPETVQVSPDFIKRSRTVGGTRKRKKRTRTRHSFLKTVNKTINNQHNKT